MQTEISYIVNNLVERKGDRVLVRYAGTENVISKAEIEGSITDDMVKAWRLCLLRENPRISELIFQ